MASGALGGGATTFKYIVMLFNLLFLAIGLGLIGVSSWLVSEFEFDGSALNFDTVPIIAIPIVGIVLGLVIAVSSFMGCFGAIKENGCLIKTNFALMVVLVIVELGLIAGVIYYSVDPSISSSIEIASRGAWIDCAANIGKTTCAFINETETKNNCCGFDGPAIDNTPEALECQNTYNFTTGCKDAVLTGINGLVAPIGGTLGGALFIQIFVMIGSCCVIKGISDDTKYA